MKTDFRIEIPKPCRAGWENMEAAEKGRFCGECSKIVIDFTNMSTDEIKSYFLQHKDQKICGHFISSQITKSTTKKEEILVNLHNKAEEIKYRIPIIAATFLIFSMMTLTGCGGGEEHVDGKIEKIDYSAMLDTLLHHHHPDTIIVDEEPDSLKKQENH